MKRSWYAKGTVTQNEEAGIRHQAKQIDFLSWRRVKVSSQFPNDCGDAKMTFTTTSTIICVYPLSIHNCAAVLEFRGASGIVSYDHSSTKNVVLLYYNCTVRPLGHEATQ